ncbi:MAG: acyl-[acyl-carrier-protein] thioesterase [Chloroflexota bacterium]
MASFRSHALTHRIRFDEAAPDGSMRAAAVVRVLQDVAWRHTEAVGLGRAWYAERGVGWLARALDLELRAPLPHGTTVTCTTDVTGWRRITCRRRTVITDADGATLAVAHVDWAFVDAAGRPARIPPDVLAFAPDAGPFAPTKVTLPEMPATIALPLTLRHADLDPMGHVNNAAYLDLVDETLRALPGGGAAAAPCRILLEHLAPALPGMTLVGSAWVAADGTRAWALRDAAGAELARATVHAPG